MSKRFSSNGLILNDGTEIPLFAGEYHYWHHDAESWKESLQALKDMGITVISTCVPWNEHEDSAGTMSFAGDRDLGAFLDAVASVGLLATLHLGPAVGAGLNYAGLPERIVADKDVAAISCRSTPLASTSPPKMFSIPSYASNVFRKEVVEWFGQVGAVVAPRLHDNGGAVVSVSVDVGQSFWRLGAFEGDYHPDALAWWHEYAGEIAAPRVFDPEDMQRVLLWMKFKEAYVARALLWLTAAAAAAGMAPCNVGLRAAAPMLVQVPMAQKRTTGLIGMDFSDAVYDYDRIRQRAMYLSSTTTLPYASCLPVGGAFFLPVREDSEEKNIVLGALAGGVRAFHLYMAHSRPRWQGGIVDRAKAKHHAGSWVGALLAALHRVQFFTLRRQTSAIALIVGRAEVRAAVASSALETISPSITELLSLGSSGFAELAMDESGRNYPKWISGVAQALDLVQVPYRIVDEESLHVLDPSTQAVIYPTQRRVDAAAWAGLHMLAEAGLRVVVGPTKPTEDELGRPLGSLATLPKGAGMLTPESLDDLAGLSNDLIGLAGELGDLWIAPETPDIDCSVFEDTDGIVRALFVGNRGFESQNARINVPDGCSLEDAISGECFSASAGAVGLVLSPQEVRFFLVGC